MAKDNERELAKTLFLETNKTFKEIAAIVGVGEKTVGAWAKEDEWEDLKKSLTVRPERIVQNLYKELQEFDEYMKGLSLPERIAIAPKVNDARAKCVKVITLLKREVGLTQIVTVCTRLIDKIAKKDLELAKKMQPYVDELLREASKEIR